MGGKKKENDKNVAADAPRSPWDPAPPVAATPVAPQAPRSNGNSPSRKVFGKRRTSEFLDEIPEGLETGAEIGDGKEKDRKNERAEAGADGSAEVRTNESEV